jgi:lipopolysaccharide transport system ATP-binding protein
MSNVVISVENLSKAYRLGQIGTGTLSHDLNVWWAKVRGKPNPLLKIGEQDHGNRDEEELWALRDVSFTVEQGEALGIIGRNGAGKSTLLKILSRVTAPTSGKVKVEGRIASLLEVGTGFHPELTGRENIYLNGAIMGMNKAEISHKFDEIVDFSGVEQFIDTPVKRYSSGMYVRLAFAVAAHLDPEILVVDEVLAVGDAEFQKKCLGKMGDLSKGEGRTVLFVSHNMAAVRKLCNKSILLESGSKTLEGDTNIVIDNYLLGSTKKQNSFMPISIKEIGVVVTKIAINEDDGGKVFPFKPLRIDIEMDAQHDVDNIGIQIMLSHDHTEGQVFSTNTKQTKGLNFTIKKGKNHFTCMIEKFNLCSGTYRFGFAIDVPFVKFYFLELDLFSFEVIEVMPEHGVLPTLPSYGHVYLEHNWIINKD